MTFDDGPNPKTTHQLLRLLKKRGIKVTFFVLGKNAEKYPDTIAWAYNDGHEIGSHSRSHPDLRKVSQQGLVQQVDATDKVIQKATK